MLCVTGADRTVAALSDRLARHARAELQEIRLDMLTEPLSSVASLGIDPKRLLLACRPKAEGGEFYGSETERVACLTKHLDAHPAWLDIELGMETSDRRKLMDAARRSGTRVLISHHAYAPISRDAASEALTRMRATGADAVKLALAVGDAADLSWLSAISLGEVPLVVLGMGPAGLLSRALYPRFRSAWTYVASREASQTAPGQLTAGKFGQWRLPPGEHTGLYALIGGLQVMRSPGPSVYNAIFASQGIDACYLPVVTERAADVLRLLRELGFRGASVTMPLKQEVIPFLDACSPEAEAAGAVNTVTLEKDGRLTGDLTDGQGAVAAIEQAAGSVSGKQAVVLGTGGTARALASSLGAAGATLSILGRKLEKAQAVAARLGCRAGKLDELAHTPFDLLIQTTPVGSANSDQTLVPDGGLLVGKVVLDVSQDVDTRLLRDARAAGATVITGRSMWAQQGRLQMAHWLGLKLSAQELEVDP